MTKDNRGEPDHAAATQRALDKAKRGAENSRVHHVERQKMLDQRSLRGIAKRQTTSLGREMKPVQRKPGVPMDFRLMSIEQLQKLAAELLRAEKYDWKANARHNQMFPEGAKIWLMLCGRGFGKTRAAVEEVREVCKKPGAKVCMIAKDHKALREVCLEGKSGLIACIPPEDIKKVHKGLGDIKVELTNGSVIIGYTAMEPDAVRGTAFDLIWGDEFAAWPKNRAQDMLDQALLTMRESEHGVRCILSTTPKRIPHVVEMVKLAENPEEGIVVTRGSSRENTVLTEDWFRVMERKLGGTRLGRQEMDGELVMDVDNALWTGHMIDEARWPEDQPLPPMIGVMTGVDPSGSKDGDATGVVTVGWDKQKQLYVLDNATTKGELMTRYSAVCMSAHKFGAGEIWVEWAFGGEGFAFGIEQTWKALQEEGLIPEEKKCPRVQKSTIQGDKAKRAGPLVALYEQQTNKPEFRNIWHVQPTAHLEDCAEMRREEGQCARGCSSNCMSELEDECLSWSTDEKKSPNAIDALVHAGRAVMRRLGMEGTVGSFANPQNKRRINRGGYDPYSGR